MRILGGALAAVTGFALLVGVSAQAGDAIDAKKLVGVWKVAKSKEAPPGATIEFTKDGKLNITFEVKGKTFNPKGTYKVEGNKIKSHLEFMGEKKDEVITIQTLTDTKLVTKDEKGEVEEFQRQK
jgi:uncharacterized protein (TIGR03066 family)